VQWQITENVMSLLSAAVPPVPRFPHFSLVAANGPSFLRKSASRASISADVRPEKMRLIYERVESPFAVTCYRGTVEVFESFDGLGIVVWTNRSTRGILE
jgi:hypothetical protein